MVLVYPPPPPKFCITMVFDLSWDDCNTQEKLETIVMQFILFWGGRWGVRGGVNKMHYGLCETGELTNPVGL